MEDTARPHRSKLLCNCDNCASTLNRDGTHGVYRSRAEHKAHRQAIQADRWVVGNIEPEVIYEPTDSSDDSDQSDIEEVLDRESSRFEPEYSAEGKSPIEFSTERYFEQQTGDEFGIAQAVIFISLSTSLFFSLSRRSSDLLLRLLRCLVGITLRLTVPEQRAKQILAGIPTDSRTVRSKYGLDQGSKVYAVCPKCHAIHEARNDDGIGERLYPNICTAVTKPHGPLCDETLLHPDGKTPVKKFIHNSVIEFIASLVTQESIEISIDEACDRLRSSDGSINEIHGPFQADFLRHLAGHQPEKLFVDRGVELRLAFALNVDFFDVEGVRNGAASVSRGIISLVCLNLPEDVRYKDENMFLAGIIPGPGVPSRCELNHYLSPIVNNFLALWDPGVRFSRTASAQQGRLARAVIALVMCDLPASRKVAGVLGHSNKGFVCPRCQCTKETLGNVDSSFGSRDSANLCYQAKAWRDSMTTTERKKITNTYGLRWSELWRLPYWDPTKQLVVDPIHCLLLDLVRSHFSSVLPLKATLDPRSQSLLYDFDFAQVPTVGARRADQVCIAGSTFALKERAAQDVLDIHRILLQPIDAKDAEAERSRLSAILEKKQKLALMFVADSLGLLKSFRWKPEEGAKKRYFVNALTAWRYAKPLQAFQLTTPGLIVHIQEVIATTSGPSFVRSVPHDFGSASAEKIKPDEWHKLCTIFLPLALVSYCFFSPEITDPEYKACFGVAVDNTMELMQAVSVLFRQSTSVAEAQAYQSHVKKYMSGLKTVHPVARFTPNMHMLIHIVESLQLFGPIFSWWTYPLERLMGKFKDVLSNDKLGQFEGTMLSTFLSLARMKQLVSRDVLCVAVKSCLEAIRDTLEKDEAPRSSPPVVSGYMPFNEAHQMTADIERILNQNADKLVRSMMWNNSVFCVRDEEHLGIGNSQIMFSSMGIAVPGIVEYIIGGDVPVFIVRRFLLPEIPQGEYDPFGQFPDLRMCMFITKPDQELEVVDSRAVAGFFASYAFGGFHVVVPLYKV